MTKTEEFYKFVRSDPELFAIFNKERVDCYNSGLDTAINLVREGPDYESSMLGITETLICGLENSKLHIYDEGHSNNKQLD